MRVGREWDEGTEGLGVFTNYSRKHGRGFDWGRSHGGRGDE
jgi:hypothetical protein